MATRKAKPAATVPARDPMPTRAPAPPALTPVPGPDLAPEPDQSWVAAEFARDHFVDPRLHRRAQQLVGDFAQRLGNPTPFACQDWANTKAAYRFFANPRVSEADILRAHCESTRQRVQAALALHDEDEEKEEERRRGSPPSARVRPVLILHDTCEFSYQRENIAGMGLLGRPALSRGTRGPRRHFTVCGLLMHSSLALTLDGLPLGLAAIKFWTRQKFKGTDALKRKINPTRVPIEEKESFRWLENLRQSSRLCGRPAELVHVGDREADIFELFCTAAEESTHFLVRTCVDRLAGEAGELTIAEALLEGAGISGTHRLPVRTKDGRQFEVAVALRCQRLRVQPPIGKQKRYPSLELTVIHATEVGSSAEQLRGREPINWQLLTDLPVDSLAAAIEKLGWYALRWKIEVYHKILKSGCRAEDSLLRSAEGIVKLLAVFCIVSWRVFWLTMLGRSAPAAPATLALSDQECAILERVIKPKAKAGVPDGDEADPTKTKTVAIYLLKVARLGGYLARGHDGPPGHTVIWRGLRRLADILFGVEIAQGMAETCG